MWEWVEDWWVRIYTEEPQVDPAQNTVENSDRMIRGGGVSNLAISTKSGARTAIFQGSSDWPDIGSRVVRSAPESTAVSPTSWGALKKRVPLPMQE